MLKVSLTKKFRKDLKRVRKRGFDTAKLDRVVILLAKGERLPEKYKDHELQNSKDYIDLRECHIEPDWLLVYRLNQNEVTLVLFRTGTHSDLFNK